jgi:hypothetical protein
MGCAASAAWGASRGFPRPMREHVKNALLYQTTSIYIADCIPSIAYKESVGAGLDERFVKSSLPSHGMAAG